MSRPFHRQRQRERRLLVFLCESLGCFNAINERRRIEQGIIVLKLLVVIVVITLQLIYIRIDGRYVNVFERQLPTTFGTIHNAAARSNIPRTYGNTTLGTTSASKMRSNERETNSIHFTILHLPELTTWLIGNYTNDAMSFYSSSSSINNASTSTTGTLNEEQGEIWLHRGFLQLLQHQQQQKQQQQQQQQQQLKQEQQKVGVDQSCVNGHHNVVIICAYLHFNHFLYKQQGKRRKGKRQFNSHQKQHGHRPYAINEMIGLLKERILATNQRILNMMYVNESLCNDTRKPPNAQITYVLAVPTWNPKRGNEIGLYHIQQLFSNLYHANTSKPMSLEDGLSGNRIQYMSLGFERNTFWQKVPSPTQIIPIPYVVSVDSLSHANALLLHKENPSVKGHKTHQLQEQQSGRWMDRSTFLFYAGDTRPNAVKWSGCNRTALLQPFLMLMNNQKKGKLSYSNTSDGIFIQLSDSKRRRQRKNSTVRTVTNQTNWDGKRLSMIEYSTMMLQSKYCLIVCGDTPTSRSLSSAIIHGCIPYFIGMQRWYGQCIDSTCHPGWGWNVLHNNSTLNAAAISDKFTHARQLQKQQPYISHFPFHTIFDYSIFPSIDEYQLLLLNRNLKTNPLQTQQLFNSVLLSTLYSKKIETTVRYPKREAFIYGYDHPVSSKHVGYAAHYIWESILDHL